MADDPTLGGLLGPLPAMPDCDGTTVCRAVAHRPQCYRLAAQGTASIALPRSSGPTVQRTGGDAPARPPAWADRAAYMRALAEVKEAATREMDLAQVGDDRSDRLLEALELGRRASESYHRAVRLAAIAAEQGTLGP